MSVISSETALQWQSISLKMKDVITKVFLDHSIHHSRYGVSAPSLDYVAVATGLRNNYSIIGFKLSWYKANWAMYTHWHHVFTSSLLTPPPATLLWQMGFPLCAPAGPTFCLHSYGCIQTQIGEPLRELHLGPLFCSSLLVFPALHILLSAFVFGLTVLSLAY